MKEGIIIKRVIKILETTDGVEVLNTNRKIFLPKLSYSAAKDIFTSNDLSPKAKKLKDNVLTAIQRNEYEVQDSIKDVYNVGNKVLLVKDYCKNCLALQYPYGTLKKYNINEEFVKEKYDKNKILTFDDDGITNINNLYHISHAKCCPLKITPLKEVVNSEHRVDESYLDSDLINKIVTSYKFTLFTLWHLEAIIFGESYTFYGLTKGKAIEKLYTFILKKFYNYTDFGIGLTMEGAFINYISNVKNSEDLNENLENVDLEKNEFFNSVNFNEEVIEAKFINIKGPFNITYLKVLTENSNYSSIGSNLEEGLADIYVQLNHKESFICNEGGCKEINNINMINTLKLLHYEDGLSKIYKFIVLGADNSV